MKTLILAAATIVVLGAASAHAEGEGDSYTGQQWAAENGNPQIPATAFFAHGAPQQGIQQHSSVAPFSGLSGNGQG